MQVALDLEGPLADIHSAIIRRSDLLNRSHFDEWGFEDGMLREFHRQGTQLWEYGYDDIPLTNGNESDEVERIKQEHDVTLLTARMYVDDSVKNWLDTKSIRYDEFIATDIPKENFGLDVYIDDNPHMFDKCNLLLYDRPWNQHLDAEESEKTVRIDNLNQFQDAVSELNI